MIFNAISKIMKQFVVFLLGCTTLFASHDPLVVCQHSNCGCASAKFGALAPHICNFNVDRPLGFFPFRKKTEAPLVALTPQQAYDRLTLGNHRFMGGHIQRPSLSSMRRRELHEKQRPFAVIVGCSDSRVPPEMIFDQGFGDLFVVRVAGQVVGPIELDSIEYGVKYLGASLVLVLGHENCGAVDAVLTGKTAAIEDVAALIEQALATTHPTTLENAVKANVRFVVEHLNDSPVIAQLKSEGKVNVVGGYYHLPDGRVEMLLQDTQKSTDFKQPLVVAF
jgi:carbonic anhydrase